MSRDNIRGRRVGVFLGYASQHGRVLLDRALYLPKDWAKDRLRRAEAHIPDDVAFATKPMLGLAMLERARVAGVPFAWITGDSVYGGVYALRQWVQHHRCGYGLTVTSAQRLGFKPVADWIERLVEADWRCLSAGDGAKGPRLYDWASLPHAGGANGFRCGLLVRRSIADPGKITFYLTHAPEATTLNDLVKVAGTRWSIESLFEQAKGEVGLDQYEVRAWVGWHRHITFAIWPWPISPPSERALSGGVDLKSLAEDLLPLTVPEIRHRLASIIARPTLDREKLFRWSEWRRRHQQRARRAHWTRQARSPPKTRL